MGACFAFQNYLASPANVGITASFHHETMTPKNHKRNHQPEIPASLTQQMRGGYVIGSVSTCTK